MSVTVNLDQLAGTLAEFASAYLVTVGDDFRAHAIAVDPLLVDGMLHIGTVGRSTCRNISQHGNVTLIWPPREPGGYTLIVDGEGRLEDVALSVTPTSAVLHRRANADSPPRSATGCADDCMRLDG